MEGYAQLAHRMSTNPDLAILRGFSALNHQNLLYLQAEVTILETRLREKELENTQSSDKYKKWYSRDWQTLSNSANEAGGGDESHWRLFLELRAKLKEYNEALVQQHILRKLYEPSKNGLTILNGLLEDPDCADYLLGQDRATWSKPAVRRDLVALHPPPEASFDHLTLWMVKTFLGEFHKLRGRFVSPAGADPAVVHYDDEDLLLPTTIISTVAASLLPVVATVVLYLVQSMSKRLGIVAGFTAAFSFILALLTKANRTEIFAATAAFAAVQVVFIGTNTPCSANP